MPKLCSFGCSPNGLPMHRFPKAEKFPERFKSWVAFVGGKLETKSDYEHYQKKVICDKHFTFSDRTRNKRLSALAVPTVTSDEQNLDDRSTETKSSQPSPTYVVDTELTADDDTVDISQSSPTYLDDTEDCADISPENALINELSTSYVINTDQSADVRLDSSLITQPSTSHVINIEESIEDRLDSQPSTSYIINTVRPRKKDSSDSTLPSSSLASKTVIVNEHNYSEASKSLRTTIIKDTKTKPGNTFQYIMKNMRTPLQLLVNMQFQSKKKPKYRQFTIEEKILALSLYRKSAKGYLLLKKYFTLPSLKTMERLSCSFKPGYKYTLI